MAAVKLHRVGACHLISDRYPVKNRTNILETCIFVLFLYFRINLFRIYSTKVLYVSFLLLI